MKGSRLALRLPRKDVAQMRKIAKLAGVTVSQLVAVALATYIVKEGRKR